MTMIMKEGKEPSMMLSAKMDPSDRNDADKILIEMVKSRPHLYDPTWKDYKDVEGTSSSWQAIADVLGCDWKDCKDRWRKLRDSYVKQKKKMVRLADDPEYAKRVKWRYYDDMDFLSSYVRHRKPNPLDAPEGYYKSENSLYYIKKASPNDSRFDEDSDGMNCEADQSCDMVITDNQHDILVDDPAERQKCARKYMESVLKKRQIEIEKKEDLPIKNNNQNDSQSSSRDQSTNNNNEPIDTSPVSVPPAPPIEDEEALFGMMVGAALKKFTPRLRSLAKMKINTIIYEIEEHQYQVSAEEMHNQRNFRPVNHNRFS